MYIIMSWKTTFLLLFSLDLEGETLLLINYLGFRRRDSTVNQLSYLYNTFCQALDAGKEVRAILCDISKAFDRV